VTESLVGYESVTLTGQPSLDTAEDAFQDGSLSSATYALPRELMMAGNGSMLFITDTDALAIRKADLLTEEVTTVATGVNSWGLGQNESGQIFATDRGSTPRVVSIDDSGNIFVLAGGSAGCNDGAGSFATFRSPGGMAFNPSEGDFYVADTDCFRIRRITQTGNVTTVAGGTGSFTADGPPSVAGFRSPTDVAFGNNRLFVNDDNRVRIVDITSGYVVTTLAGSRVNGRSDGIGTNASFSELDGIAYFEGQDGVGMVVTVDDTAHNVRLINAETAEVTTIAGSPEGLSGLQDGTSSLFNQPYGVDATADGGIIYVADRGNARVAMLTLTNVTIDETVTEEQLDETTLIVAIVVPLSIVLIIGFVVVGWCLYRSRRNKARESKETIPSGGGSSARASIFGSVPLHDPSDIKIFEKLGEGNFGTTYRAKLINNGTVVALKIPKHATAFSTDDVRELNALMGLHKHPNLLEFIGIVSIEGKVCVITAFYARGSLDKLHHKIDMVKEKRFLRIVRDVASGLKAFHDQNMIHRDLACRNLLMKSDGVVVIADYGLTQKVEVDKDYYMQHTSTLPWAWTAPESLRTRRFTTKSDIYSIGVAFWEILTKGKYPHGKRNVSILENHPARQIATGELKLEIPGDSKASDASRELVYSCLSFEPAARPSAYELLRKLEELGYAPTFYPGNVFLRVHEEAHKHDVSSPSAAGGYQDPIEVRGDVDGDVDGDEDTLRTDAGATYGRRANEKSEPDLRDGVEEESKHMYAKHETTQFRAKTA